MCETLGLANNYFLSSVSMTTSSSTQALNVLLFGAVDTMTCIHLPQCVAQCRKRIHVRVVECSGLNGGMCCPIPYCKLFLSFFLPPLLSSLITHGFGTPAICAALSTFQTVLSEMLNYLEKHTTHKNGGAADSGQGHGTSEKAPLRKTSEAAVKEGKTEKTD